MQIDLEPHQFSSGRSRRSANAHGLLGVIGLAILAFIWWNRAEVSNDALFWVTVACGLPTGGFLMVFLNQWRGV
jgi:hypothetical protein